eukprot:16146-Amphidinium_carterae.2
MHQASKELLSQTLHCVLEILTVLVLVGLHTFGSNADPTTDDVQVVMHTAVSHITLYPCAAGAQPQNEDAALVVSSGLAVPCASSSVLPPHIAASNTLCFSKSEHPTTSRNPLVVGKKTPRTSAKQHTASLWHQAPAKPCAMQ